MDDCECSETHSDVILEEEFGEDLRLSSEDESLGERNGVLEKSKVLVSGTRRYSTTQLFTTSAQKHFEEACTRFASRRQYKRMAEYCNRTGWKAGTVPLDIRAFKAVDMAWRCNLLEEALTLFPSSGARKRIPYPRGAQEATEEELTAELQEAEQGGAQEERDVRAIEGRSRKSNEPLLNCGELGRRAQEILRSPDALVTQASIRELSVIIEDWTRDLVKDITRYEQERRWGRLATVKTPYIHTLSIDAALRRRGFLGKGSLICSTPGKVSGAQNIPSTGNDTSRASGHLARKPPFTDHGWLSEELLKLQDETKYH